MALSAENKEGGKEKRTNKSTPASLPPYSLRSDRGEILYASSSSSSSSRVTDGGVNEVQCTGCSIQPTDRRPARHEAPSPPACFMPSSEHLATVVYLATNLPRPTRPNCASTAHGPPRDFVVAPGGGGGGGRGGSARERNRGRDTDEGGRLSREVGKEAGDEGGED